MFPGLLAEGPFSLRQGEACYALSFGVELTPEGIVAERTVVASRIIPTRRMTYDEVDAAIESGDPASLPPDLQALLKVGCSSLLTFEALRAHTSVWRPCRENFGCFDSAQHCHGGPSIAERERSLA